MRRTALAVVSLLAAAVLQPVTAGQALAPAERAARISLSAPTKVAPHSLVVLRGRTGAHRGAKVKVYQRPVDRSSWNLEGTTRVKKRGKFRYSEGVTDFSRYYRACVRRSCSAARLVTVSTQTPTPTPTPIAPQPTSLTLTGGPSAEIEAGQSITASGTASANLINRNVALQAYDATNKSWGAIGGAVVDGAGNWTVSGPIGTAGKIGVRVVALATATTQESYVGAGIITVFGWYALDDYSMPAEITGSMDYGPVTINAIPYASGVGFSSSSSSVYGEWNLSRSCKTFSATVGLPDDASTTSRYSFQLFADSVQKAEKAGLALGTSTPVSIDITNALRLKISRQRTAGSYYDNYDDLLFGDAKALCSF